MANDYGTIATIKARFADEPTWSTSYDSILGTIIDQASRVIDLYLGRAPGSFAVSADSTRYFNGSRNARQLIDEMCAVPTSVSIATGGVIDGAGGTGGTYTAIAKADYLPHPYNWADEGIPFVALDLDLLNGSYSTWYGYPKGVKIVGKFGYATTAGTPPEIVQAAEITAIRAFQRGKQGFRDVGAIAELSQLRYVRTLDPDVQEIIEHLRKIPI